MADASFDVVSKVDRQEVDNALNQAGKELSQRFDFRGTNATIAWAGEEGSPCRRRPRSGSRRRPRGVQGEADQRGISLKVLDAGEPQASGKVYKIARHDQAGHRVRRAKEIAKPIRDEESKGVQAQIQGDQLRVSGKKRTTGRRYRTAQRPRLRDRPAVHQLPVIRRRSSGADLRVFYAGGLGTSRSNRARSPPASVSGRWRPASTPRTC